MAAAASFSLLTGQGEAFADAGQQIGAARDQSVASSGMYSSL
jgi:hypothetical protein